MTLPGNLFVSRSEQKWDLRFLAMAQLVSGWSKDPSTKTGAVIVRPDRSVVSLGFNGFARQMDDAKELYEDRPTKYSRIIHCEVNALIQAKQPIEGCTLYTYPFISCDRCIVQMIQAGITRFVSQSPSEDALSRWSDAFEKSRAFMKEAGAEVREYRVETD